MLWQIYIVLNDLSKNIRFVYILILQHPIRLYICILHAFIHASPLRVYMYIEIILHVTWSDGQAVCGVLVMTGRKTSVWFSHTRLMIYEVQNNIYKKKQSFYSILVKQTNNNYLRSEFNELVHELLSVVQKKSQGRRYSDTR